MTDMPTLGLFGTNMGVCGTADGAARIGVLAEELGLRNEAQAARRDLAGFTITVSPAERLDPDSVRAFGDLGVDRLVLVPRLGLSLPDLDAYVRARAPERVGAESLQR